MKRITQITHNTIKRLRLEKVVIKKSLKKFIPLHKSYAQQTIKKVKRDNTYFSLDISDYMQWHIWANLEDLSWKKGIKQKEGHVLDVGANVGAFSLKTLKNTNHNLTIHAFEPNPFVYNQLEQNFSLNTLPPEHYKLNNIGLSNQQGFLDFYWNKENTGGGSFAKNNNSTQSQKIAVTTIDEYVAKNQLENIAFIKIDVEGYEPEVLEGAKETLTQHRPTLFIEVSPEWWRNNNYDVLSVLTVFKELNYQFFPIIDEKEQSEMQLSGLSNIRQQYNLYLIPQ